MTTLKPRLTVGARARRARKTLHLSSAPVIAKTDDEAAVDAFARDVRIDWAVARREVGSDRWYAVGFTSQVWAIDYALHAVESARNAQVEMWHIDGLQPWPGPWSQTFPGW